MRRIAILFSICLCLPITQAQRNPTPAEIRSELDRIVFPELSFEDANIYDVVNYLIETGRSCGGHRTPDRYGVNIILDPRSGGDVIAPIPRITIERGRITMGEAVSLVCELAGLKASIYRGSIVLRPEKAKMTLRGMPAFPSLLRVAQRQAINQGEAKPPVLETHIRELGLPMPPGAALSHDASTDRINMLNLRCSARSSPSNGPRPHRS